MGIDENSFVMITCLFCFLLVAEPQDTLIVDNCRDDIIERVRPSPNTKIISQIVEFKCTELYSIKDFDFSTVTHLNLYGNPLSSVENASLKSLIELDISNTNVSSIHNSICLASGLKRIRGVEVLIKELPECFCEDISIEVLDPIVDSRNTQLKDCKSLRNLTLSLRDSDDLTWIGQIDSLKRIGLINVRAMQIPYGSIPRIVALSLMLKDDDELPEILKGLSQFQSLETLELVIRSKSFDTDLSSLKNLKKLIIRRFEGDGLVRMDVDLNSLPALQSIFLYKNFSKMRPRVATRIILPPSMSEDKFTKLGYPCERYRNPIASESR